MPKIPEIEYTFDLPEGSKIRLNGTEYVLFKKKDVQCLVRSYISSTIIKGLDRPNDDFHLKMIADWVFEKGGKLIKCRDFSEKETWGLWKDNALHLYKYGIKITKREKSAKSGRKEKILHRVFNRSN